MILKKKTLRYQSITKEIIITDSYHMKYQHKNSLILNSFKPKTYKALLPSAIFFMLQSCIFD